MKPLRVAHLLLAMNLPLLAAAALAQSPAASEGKSVAEWIDQLKSDEFRQQWYAAYELGMLGPKAAPAVPALHAILDVNSRKNEYARSMAAWALGRIGPAAEAEIPLLVETMRSTKLLAVRRSAAEALGNLGPAAKPAVGALLTMLQNDDDISCVNAAVAIWKIDRNPKAVPALREMLRHGNTSHGNKSQAFAAAVALGQMGADAGEVAPALIEALHSTDADVRRAAARSLGQLGKAAFRSFKEANVLHDPDPEARREVVEALGWMGPVAVPALIAALKDKDSSPAVRRAAARALGRLGTAAQSALSALETAASDSQEDVRTAAAKALRQIRGE
jgi:HEAT repeat protein